jgi:hypothetical protein
MNYLPLAEQCGLIEEHPVNHSSVEYLADLQRFAELVAAHERQACAMVVEINAMACNEGILKKVLNANADAIRARGQE